jgi:hypothetical protein
MKHKKVFLATLLAISGFAVQAAQAAGPVSISDGLVSATIANNGQFFSGTSLGLNFAGTEFVNLGTYASWSWLKAGGVDYHQSEAGGTNDLALTVYNIGVASTTVGFAATPLNVVETLSAVGATNSLSVTVSITNTSGAALNNVYWGVGIDPDQNLMSGGGYATINSITGLNGNAAVTAGGTTSPYSVTLMNNTTSGALDIKGFINVGNCCGDVDPLYAYTNGQALGFVNNGDDSISLAYKIGTLAAGQTATLGYNYVFSPVPEAETYAMMLAGLGLVGFMARRRTSMSV